MQFGWSAKETSARVLRLAVIAAVILTAIYILIYWLQPFTQIWNTILSDLFLVIASSFAAIVATLIWLRYDPLDAPRRVWGPFAIGLWLWVVAETIWGYLNVTQGEVPEGPADVFWIVSYLFFAQALLFQYRIVAHPTKRELMSRSSIAIFFLLALCLLIYGVLHSASASAGRLDAAINSFYPAADLLLALIALWLARNFMGGAFSRPWLGLLAFSFADLLYAWIEVSGLYSWSANQGNLLSGISDVAYLAAYLVLGLGILSHWVFLKYGLRSPTIPRQSRSYRNA
jgi:hypothetical protein